MEDDENFNAWHIEKGMICNRPHAYIDKLVFFCFFARSSIKSSEYKAIMSRLFKEVKKGLNQSFDGHDICGKEQKTDL